MEKTYQEKSRSRDINLFKLTSKVFSVMSENFDASKFQVRYGAGDDFDKKKSWLGLYVDEPC